MTVPPSNEFNQQVPVYEALPEEWEKARGSLVERSKELANAINIRTVGWQIDFEIVTGKKFMPVSGSQEFRDILRKTIEIGALPNNSTKNVAHTITNVNDNFRLMSMLGAATNPITFQSLPLPYASVAGNDVEIKMDDTNITINTNFDYSAFTDSVVVLEYTTRN